MDVATEVLQVLLSKPGSWFDSVSVGKRLAPLHAEPETVADQARLEERLFAVWDGDRFRFPAFQFTPDGSPLEATAALIQVLPRDQDGKVGLDAALWAYTPDAALDNLSPAELFTRDPSRVVLLARRRLHGSDSDD